MGASTIPHRPDTGVAVHSRGGRAVAIVAVLLPPAVGFLLPFVGVAVSVIATPILGIALGPMVWRARRVSSLFAGIATVVAVWGPAWLGMLWRQDMLLEYRLIPLCSPRGVGAMLISLASVGVYASLSAVSIRIKNVWLWPFAALAGGIAFELLWAVFADGIRWMC